MNAREPEQPRGGTGGGGGATGPDAPRRKRQPKSKLTEVRAAASGMMSAKRDLVNDHITARFA